MDKDSSLKTILCKFLNASVSISFHDYIHGRSWTFIHGTVIVDRGLIVLFFGLISVAPPENFSSGALDYSRKVLIDIQYTVVIRVDSSKSVNNMINYKCIFN